MRKVLALINCLYHPALFVKVNVFFVFSSETIIDRLTILIQHQHG
jgi:hypothetical protein